MGLLAFGLSIYINQTWCILNNIGLWYTIEGATWSYHFTFSGNCYMYLDLKRNEWVGTGGVANLASVEYSYLETE